MIDGLRAIITAFALLTAGAHGADAPGRGFGADAGLAMLDPAQKVLAERMTAFAARMDDKYFARIAELNGGLDEEFLLMEHESADYDIRVTRGGVVEKAGRMYALVHRDRPGRGPDNGPLTWGRFYSLDIHPKTPLVGMLHATVVLQMYANGAVVTGGWLDVMPGTRIDADIALLRQVVDDYFAAADKDPSLYRRLVCKGTEDTVAEHRRRPSCAGVSFYGPPVYPADGARSFEFIGGLFERFVDAFLDVTERRADNPFTAADLEAQDAMRKRWLVDQLFSDPYSSEIVPFETWFLANVPPVIKF